uniref:Glutathione transferase n=1 Tax=Entomoneis paludosa TaxID=265537 RepID=A0A6U2YMJ0_9STRA|eukprot:CAMPEP_0172449250 /NCGR_PEP_ID=MMETSP1065-20121228/8001_1 /TAXON_ID=265537 /ORGANISM="Amphiprora paludosa, Strain CCMP125" /LENGTH=196 /DNA_ID=CAMNT_0013200877 /DNA_START=46 /DNA_END=636 /DNA_ORIENTATION=+
MATGFMIKSFAAAGIGAFVETKYGPSLQPTGPAGLSPLFAATPLVLIGVGFYTLTMGMEVGKARNKYMELAKKDGEKEVEERYGLPNLYAQGTSKHAKAFNAVQRAHQHIFETFTTVSIFGLAGALELPICTAISTMIYAYGRRIFSNNYSQSEGDVGQRYSKNPHARLFWVGMLGNMVLGVISCVKILSKARLAE